MPLPTFFVIGAMKAGTTSLHVYLAEHPEIHMSSVKEPHFFAREEDGPYPHRVRERAEYEALFDSPLKVRGESSPTYTLYPRHQDVPRRIHELVPRAKFIYLVRDPMERVVSHYLHNVAVGGVRASFSEHTGDLSDPGNPYVYPTLYSMQLDRYLEYFPQESVLVVDQRDLARDRTRCLKRIFAFLGVEPTYECEAFHREYGAAADRRKFPAGYDRLRNRLASLPLRWLPRNFRRSLRRRTEQFLWAPVPRPDVSDAALANLWSVCGPDVERLRARWGLELPGWGGLNEAYDPKAKTGAAA